MHNLVGAESGAPGVSPEHPEADRVAERAADAARVGADDPYVVN